MFRLAGIAIIGVFLLAFSARGGALSIEGIVKDRAGRPIKGADIHIQTKDFSKVVKTDANGHYRSDVVAAGNYKVTVLVNGSVQASMVQPETPLAKSMKLNFNPGTQSRPANKHKRMVWVAPEIGTHIGGGSWIEVDDENPLASHVTANNVKKRNGNTLTLDLSVNRGANCTCLGGGGSGGLAGGSGAGLAAGRPVSSFASASH